MTTPLTLTQIAELRALLKQAIPGEWKADSYGLYIFSDKCSFCDSDQNMVTAHAFEKDDEEGNAKIVNIRGWGHLQKHGEERAIGSQKGTASFIAVSHNSMPTLLDTAESELRLRERVKELEARLPAIESASNKLVDFLAHYGTGLQVTGYHLNGEEKPLDEFIDESELHEAMSALVAILDSEMERCAALDHVSTPTND